MAIQLKRDELLRQGARINLPRPVAQTPVKKPSLEVVSDALVVKISDLISTSTDERQAQLRAVKELGSQIAAALSSLKYPQEWAGNWNVTITRRDALGRISEVQFRPAKP